MTNNPKDTFELCYYLVAFIDILGQKEALQELERLPKTDEEREVLYQTLKKTYGVVDKFRTRFKRYFDEIRNADKECKIRLHSFSDAIIIHVPLGQRLNQIPMIDIYASIATCAAVFLDMLSEQHACRGGIEVGVAGEMYEGEIYGAALNKAYQLEKHIALYPRIVVGQMLIDYLMIHKESDQSDASTKEMARKCLRLLKQDIDGHPFLDYLGEEFMELMRHIPLKDGTVEKAYDFVKAEAVRWKQQKNTTLAFRYNLLGNYCASRLSLWQDVLNKK